MCLVLYEAVCWLLGKNSMEFCLFLSTSGPMHTGAEPALARPAGWTTCMRLCIGGRARLACSVFDSGAPRGPAHGRALKI